MTKRVFLKGIPAALAGLLGLAWPKRATAEEARRRTGGSRDWIPASHCRFPRATAYWSDDSRHHSCAVEIGIRGAELLIRRGRGDAIPRGAVVLIKLEHPG